MIDYTAGQQEAINNTAGATAAVAGAGSGKTRVLVGRYLRLLEDGIDCREILAITFTEKAAAELSGRIRDGILKRAGAARDRAFWLSQKDALSAAYIGTIHGLCAAVIRAKPLAAGVEPDFYIASETEGQQLLLESLQASCAELLPKDAAFAALCREYGYPRLYRWLSVCLGQFSLDEVRQADFAGKLSSGYKNAPATLTKAKAAFTAALRDLLDTPPATLTPRQAQTLDGLASVSATLLQATDNLNPANITLAERLLKPLEARGKIAGKIQAVKAAWSSLTENYRDCLALPLIPSWAGVLKKCVEDFSALKRRRGAVTFDDLEYLAWKLLSEDKALRARLSDKYKQVMVDEFQDTNERQKQIACFLAGGDCAPKGGKLFIAGDARQSIYRFRGADVSVFGQVRREIQTLGGREIELADNFRARPELVAFCNDLFTRVFSSPADSRPMQAGRKTADTLPAPVEILLADGAAQDKHDAEAELLARRLLALYRDGQPFSGMAVLLRAKTHLAAYTAAFTRYNIPYNVLDGQGFFQTAEISDLLNLLRFLDNCLRDLPLLGLLRSPLFGLDDHSLTIIALAGQGGCLWEKLLSRPAGLTEEQRARADRAAKRLGVLLNAARAETLGPLLRAAIADLKIMPLLLSYPDGRQKYANAEKFIDLAFAFEQEKNGGLPEFIAHIDELTAMDAREGLEQLEDENSEAVKLLTIHKAKGLEFDVVALADCGAPFPKVSDEFFYRKDYGLAVKVSVNGRLEPTACLLRARDAEKVLERAELERLLYVALTRAKEKLILSAGRQAEESWLGWLYANASWQADGCLQCGQSKIYRWQETTAADALNEPANTERAYDFAALWADAQPLPAAPPGLSATALIDYKHCPRLFYYKHAAGLAEYYPDAHGGQGLSPRLAGLLIHEAIRLSDRYTLDDALAQARAMYPETGGEWPDLKTWLAAYLDSAVAREIEKEQKLREVAFRLPLLLNRGEINFSGSIDCLILRQDNSMEIIDYKTGKTNADEYALQLMLYTLAAEKLYPNRQVERACLHFIREGRAAAVDIKGERTRYIEEIQHICDEISGKRTQQDFAPRREWCGRCGYAWLCGECAS